MTDTPHFPLSAVVGADKLKLALCLTAIDPKIGGVLIEGPRGMAKSTLARGLADLLASGQFVTLPLGATEERLVGTLDLDAALGEGRAQFSPGVLAKADGGVLYVDEVNLLADHLVDLLLDVAASGINLIERDGISHRHSARFVLIGTMNPEEGELRPQLLDRFGFNVALTGRPCQPNAGRSFGADWISTAPRRRFAHTGPSNKRRCVSVAPRRVRDSATLNWMTRPWPRLPSVVLPPVSTACVRTWSGCAAPGPMPLGAALMRSPRKTSTPWPSLPCAIGARNNRHPPTRRVTGNRPNLPTRRPAKANGATCPRRLCPRAHAAKSPPGQKSPRHSPST